MLKTSLFGKQIALGIDKTKGMVTLKWSAINLPSLPQMVIFRFFIFSNKSDKFALASLRFPCENHFVSFLSAWAVYFIKSLWLTQLEKEKAIRLIMASADFWETKIPFNKYCQHENVYFSLLTCIWLIVGLSLFYWSNGYIQLYLSKKKNSQHDQYRHMSSKMKYNTWQNATLIPCG